MAVPTNTLQTYQASANAEDVSDIIYNISPVDTPFLSMAKKGVAEATYTEWTIEALDAADGTNAVIEGDDATAGASTTNTRVGNYCQIVRKVVSVSSTQNKVRKYGTGNEFAKQKAKKSKELKRDMETIMLQSQARVVGDAATAQKMRSLPGWITTNDSRGAGGADGNATTAQTDGTQRAFTESLLKSVIVQCATNANDMPTMVMAGPANRANLSSQLSGSSSKFYDIKDSTLNATISVYKSDYGPLKLTMNRFQRERDMWLLNPDFIGVRYLEPMSYDDLAKTGLSQKGQLYANFTLEVSNQAAHGVVADLLTAVI
jgi:hypothetical protein